MKRLSQILLGLVLAFGALLLGAAPEWIQYDERVVGENSPYYEDVVNRPMKTIWANFTSQHTDIGAHKTSIFPTPLPTATPQPDATPQPTATPKPDATPQPTATPIPLSLLETENTITDGTLQGYTTLSTANGNCQGRVQYITSGGLFALPSTTDTENNNCHTYRIMTDGDGITLSGDIVMDAVPNTWIQSTSYSAVELLYMPTSNYWAVFAVRGFTGYTSPPPPPES